MKENKFSRILYNMILVASLLLIGVVSIVAILYQFEQYEAITMVKLTVVITALLFLTYVGLKSLNDLLQRIPKSCMIVLAIICYFALYGFSCLVRNEPTVDYESVYDAMLALLNGTSVDWIYFARCYNNAPLLYLLTACGYVGRMIGIEDPFYTMLAFNVFTITLTLVCIYHIVGYYKPGKRYLQIFACLLLLLFLPLWGGTQNMYTESMTLLYGPLTIYCFLKRKTGSGKAWTMLAALSFAIGYLLKPTTIICVIAFFIVEIISGAWKQYARAIIVFLCSTVVLLGIYQACDSYAPYHAYDEEHRVPMQFWLALGLIGDGTYGADPELLELFAYEGTYADKEEAINSYILENWTEIGNLERMKEKVLISFGNGCFGLYYYQYFGGLGYVLFNTSSLYGTQVAQFNLTYFYLLVIAAFVAGVWNLCSKTKNTVLITWILSLFGFMLFMMLWESYDKQLYNQMPCIALLGAFSIEELSERLRSRREKGEHYVESK